SHDVQTPRHPARRGSRCHAATPSTSDLLKHALKQWRDLATRYAKRASLYQASLVLVAVIIWFP
ncbi:hypothetical protein ACFY3R_30565, partial [Micromonospora chalcea]